MLRSLTRRNSGENGAPGGTLFSQVQGLVKPKVKPYRLQLIWTGRGFKNLARTVSCSSCCHLYGGKRRQIGMRLGLRPLRTFPQFCVACRVHQARLAMLPKNKRYLAIQVLPM